MRHVTPMRLLRLPKPFDSPAFVFDPKLDGFRALAHVRSNRCELVSRNGYTFKQWPQLAEEVAHAVRARSAVLDARFAAWNPTAGAFSPSCLFRREWPFFYAFDVLQINGRDLTPLPLVERKRRLRDIMPAVEFRLLFLDSMPERGRELFRVACEHDLEGLVAKWATGTYQTDGRRTSWLKIKNPEYTQIRDRHELFEHRHPRVALAPKVRRPALVLS